MNSDTSTRSHHTAFRPAGTGHALTWHCMACQRVHGQTLGRKRVRGVWVCAESLRMKAAQV